MPPAFAALRTGRTDPPRESTSRGRRETPVPAHRVAGGRERAGSHAWHRPASERSGVHGDRVEAEGRRDRSRRSGLQADTRGTNASIRVRLRLALSRGIAPRGGHDEDVRGHPLAPSRTGMIPPKRAETRAHSAARDRRRGRPRGRARRRVSVPPSYRDRSLRSCIPLSRIVSCARPRALRRWPATLRRGRAPGLSQVWCLLGGFHARAVRCVRSRSARGVLL